MITKKLLVLKKSATDINHNEVVKTLLINGANANLLDDALYSAFSNSLGETRMYILRYATNLDLNLRNDEGNTVFEDDIKRLDIASAKLIIYHQSF